MPPGDLADSIWGDVRPGDAGNALQVLVSRLRARCGAGLVETRSAGYRLAVPPDRLDAVRFENLLAQAGEALPDVAAGLLDEALTLWRGPAFGEFTDLPLESGPAVKAIVAALEPCSAPGTGVRLTSELGYLITRA